MNHPVINKKDDKNQNDTTFHNKIEMIWNYWKPLENIFKLLLLSPYDSFDPNWFKWSKKNSGNQ